MHLRGIVAKWIALPVIVSALVALVDMPTRGHAGQYVSEDFVTINGGTKLYHYTKGDTAIVYSDPIRCFGATGVQIALCTDYGGLYTTTDSIYSDSLRSVGFSVSENDTDYTFLNHNTQKLGVLHFQPTQVDSSSTTTLRCASNTSHVFFLAPVNPIASATHPSRQVIMVPYVRFMYTSRNRNTLSGQVSTQGNRTRGLRGVTARLRVYYENP